MIISFEGIDGSGKTTIMEMTKNYFKNFLNKDVVTTKEPTGAFRDILLNKDISLSPITELFLFMADRGYDIDTVIYPALKEGKIVLIDRYSDSTLAYQHYGRGQNLQLLYNLNYMVVKQFRPDLTILLDCPVDIATTRIRNKIPDRFESLDKEFFEKVRNGYLELAKTNPKMIVINASRPANAVFLDVIQAITSKIE